jgi:hypothetical protein
VVGRETGCHGGTLVRLGSFPYVLLILFLRLFCSCTGETVPRSRSLAGPIDVSPSWQRRCLMKNASNFGRTTPLSLGLACRGIALLISHMTFFAVCYDSSSPTSSEHVKEAKYNRGIRFLVMPTLIWLVSSCLIRSTNQRLLPSSSLC